LIGVGTDDAVSLDESVDVVEIDIRRCELNETLADEAKRLWDDGKTDKQIAELLGCGRAIVKKALDCWYDRQGLDRPDGRTTKKRLKDRRKADKFQSQIMELWFQDRSVNEIAKRIDCCSKSSMRPLRNGTSRKACWFPTVVRGVARSDSSAARPVKDQK